MVLFSTFLFDTTSTTLQYISFRINMNEKLKITSMAITPSSHITFFNYLFYSLTTANWSKFITNEFIELDLYCQRYLDLDFIRKQMLNAPFKKFGSNIVTHLGCKIDLTSLIEKKTRQSSAFYSVHSLIQFFLFKAVLFCFACKYDNQQLTFNEKMYFKRLTFNLNLL